MPEGVYTMERDNIADITWLLASAKATSSFEGKRYCFQGDLAQMSTAHRIACQLNIDIDIDGGIPFAKSEEDFNSITQYIIDHRLNGWWHYQQIKGNPSPK